VKYLLETGFPRCVREVRRNIFAEYNQQDATFHNDARLAVGSGVGLTNT